jgi:hypothetical protein
MKFCWLRDWIKQGYFHIYWKPGTKNKTDYFTKHHPAISHQKMRYQYLQTAQNSLCMQGCNIPLFIYQTFMATRPYAVTLMWHATSSGQALPLVHLKGWHRHLTQIWVKGLWNPMHHTAKTKQQLST